MNKLLRILFPIFLLYGCMGLPSSPTTYPSLTPSFSSLETQTNPPIPEESPTNTPVSFIYLSSLPAGEYLVYLGGLDSSTSSEIYSFIAKPNGETQGILSQVTTTMIRISPDLHFLAELPRIKDLTTGNTTTYEELSGCQEGPSWAPDSKHLVAS